MAGDREIYAPFATHLNFLSRSTVVRLSSSRPYASSVPVARPRTARYRIFCSAQLASRLLPPASEGL